MEKSMKVLPLKPSVIYGPVNSRRLGRSLGINLSPVKRKLCSFNCIYCHYGWTERLTLDVSPYRDEFPSADHVHEAVRRALQTTKKLDYITFSGDGEPTLHPEFEAIAVGVKDIRDRLSPGTPLAVLTNATTLDRDAVRRALEHMDMRICKLDAGTQEMLERINNPAPGIELTSIAAALSSLKNVVIQTIFLGGNVDNGREEHLTAWIRLLREIRPEAVQIYSTDRPVPKQGIERVDRAALEAIGSRIEKDSGVKVTVFSLEQRDRTEKTN